MKKMKAIFELDMPESCYDCPMFNDEYATCQVTGENAEGATCRAKQCPLTPKDVDK